MDALGLLDFPYCHSVSLYETLLGAVLSDSLGIVLDYFAGSGTTGHAVINLNREDDGQRKFILVEMGGYFHTVLLPRIKKVTYTPEWKDGKPQRQATDEEAERSPRIIKYIRLESYEDALDSIEFDQSDGQLRLAEESDEYLLKYMLSWETRDSDTLLNPAKLTSPFSYRLRVHANGRSGNGRWTCRRRSTTCWGSRRRSGRSCTTAGVATWCSEERPGPPRAAVCPSSGGRPRAGLRMTSPGTGTLWPRMT